MTRSSSSSSSSSDESDQQTNMKNLADLMWQKLKNDRLTATTRKMKTDKTQAPAEKSSSSAPGNTTQGIRAIHQKSAEEALKAVSTKKVGTVESERQKKKQAKLEKSQWKWKKGTWGSMKMKEQTEEDKRDLTILNMRSTIDPTRHYKHNDLKAPKFFQIGKVEENPVNFYHDRIPKKKRKRTLLDEIMADEDFRKQTKQRYKEVMSAKAGRKGLYQGRPPQRIHKNKIKMKRRK
ncbi:deoxynucleotidyltransferase terminal-interacting protein 2-like isoform X2 [Littorina saxatilis]|uniref:deoxynucleotidyltransferase terminal-interacting protein 2-like isoform X2 n=1 Tax=Littorina saxatilis TaxID=31220 RepID=UPI0038B46A8E